MRMDAIKEFQGEYRWLSNFWLAKVRYKNIEFHTVENAYQFSKLKHPTDKEIEIFKYCKPGQAKRYMKNNKDKVIPGFSKYKDGIMYDLLRQKFSENILKMKLINTGDCLIEEGNRWGDTYWGVCNGVGENRLGKLIMKIREEIRK